MPLLADEDDRTHGCVERVQAPLHVVLLGKALNLGTQRVGRCAAHKLHPHKEQAGVVVVVLGGFFDITALSEQKARDGMHDAGFVFARKGQNVARGHDGAIVAGLAACFSSTCTSVCSSALAGVAMPWAAPRRTT